MSENFEENNNEKDIKEEIEFDDNIDIDALQKQLQQHMSDENVTYTPATGNKNDQPDFTQFSSENNALIPNNDTPDNTVDINSFMQSVDVPNDSESNTTANLNTNDNKNDEKPKLQLGEKKYIVYIEPENIDFIDALTIKERKSVINRILKEENASIKKKREAEDRVKFINQVIIMVITVVVALPIFFVLLNKSIEVTILNYQQSQQNFVKLYKEQGKIKSYKNFQKKF